MTYKPAYPHPLIAREGWPFLVGIVLISLLASFWSWWLALPCWLLTLFVLQFFRDPPRLAPVGEHLVLAPADGQVVAIEDAHDVYADRAAVKISVFMNVFNVHSNRAPVSGTVHAVQYFPGKFFNAALDKASLQNERNAVVLHTPEGHTVTAVQVAGLIARRIVCHVKPGHAIGCGERYGFIRFGSRVDVYLPPDARPRVVIGEKVSATSTVLAQLPELSPPAPAATNLNAQARSKD